MNPILRRLLSITWLAGALLSGCATQVNPVTGRSELSVMDEASEIAEGKRDHAQVLQEYGALRQPQAAGLCE